MGLVQTQNTTIAVEIARISPSWQARWVRLSDGRTVRRDEYSSTAPSSRTLRLAGRQVCLNVVERSSIGTAGC